MFKPSDPRAAAGLAAVLCAAVASAAVTPLAADEKPRAGYQLRCWQEGRLMFEENTVTLPAPGTARVVAIDRAGRPIYLVESGHATCALRHLDERPAPNDPLRSTP